MTQMPSSRRLSQRRPRRKQLAAALTQVLAPVQLTAARELMLAEAPGASRAAARGNPLLDAPEHAAGDAARRTNLFALTSNVKS